MIEQRERNLVIVARAREGHTLQRIGCEFGLSFSRVRRILLRLNQPTRDPRGRPKSGGLNVFDHCKTQ